MKIDDKTVAQAEAFVNALRAGKRTCMHPIRFEHWPLFMATVRNGMGASQGANVYPALGLA